MPHITVDGYNSELNIRKIYLHSDVEFSSDCFKSPLAQQKIIELQEKLEALMYEYFPSIESDSFTNHEWNLHMQMQKAGYG